ncbi:MAG: DMT family transporter [Acidobacteria bacterium]|nr:DMT family transporter [Acidobacteriota bacterium]MBI3423500.1 DMT family transporter [Acidobacteriota bacterium]
MSSSDVAPAVDRTAYFHMLWASLGFALMAAFSHRAGEFCDWQLVVVARASVAFCFALLLAKGAGVKLVFFSSRILWLRSLAGSASMLCNFYALAHLPVSDTLTLMNTAPIWVTMLLWLVFKQKPGTGILAAVFTSVVGIALIQQPHFQSGKFACLMALSGAFFTSIAMLGLNRLQHIDPRAIVVHFSGVASLATLAFLLLTNRKDYSAQLADKSVIGLLVLVGLAGVVGQIGMTLAFAKGQASRVAVVALTQILFGLVFDMVFWNRAINLVSWLGMVFVIVPTAWLILGRPPQQSRELIEVEMSD